jgi:hypothetical protein
VTAQVILGLSVAFVAHYPINPFHVAAALLGWLGFMVANGLDKRPEDASTARVVAGFSTACVLFAYYLGQHAAKGLKL